MTRLSPRLAAALALTALALSLAACSPPTETLPQPTTNATSPVPSDQPTTEPTQEPVGDPTCEEMIPETTVADFESVGWTSLAEPFYLGATELESGVSCTWADFNAPGGDHLQKFGWAPIDDATAAEAQKTLIADGWIREEDATGVYITENPETTIATDADGYGYTYLFGDGWVKLADTKQSLLLIEWPPAR